MFILDAHLDLAMNAVEWNRDLTQTVEDIRKSEIGMSDKPDRERNTVSLDAMRKGNIGICVATQIAGVKNDNNLSGWSSPQEAWAQTQVQLAWYKEMEGIGEMIQITNAVDLNKHLQLWKMDGISKKPIGYILSLEGADSIVDIDYLEKSYNLGLRAIGPAHYGTGTYADGTDSVGGIGVKGKELLKKIEELNLILDATHLCDASFWETMEVYNGHVWASHNNCRKFVNHNRQFSDEQINELISRDAIIGIALDAWMMVPNWQRGETTPESSGVKLEHVVDHMDHICQLAGNARHIGIGTDLDGGYGREQSPGDLDTIADLQRLPALLSGRGYSEDDIAGVMHGNFLRFLREAW